MKRLILFIMFLISASFACGQTNQIDVRRAIVRNWIIYQNDTLPVLHINGDTIFWVRGHDLDTLVVAGMSNYWNASGDDIYNNNVGDVVIYNDLYIDTLYQGNKVYHIMHWNHQTKKTEWISPLQLYDTVLSMIPDSGSSFTPWLRDTLNGFVYLSDTSDFVGIMTTTPLYNLDVRGTVGVEHYFTVNDFDSSEVFTVDTYGSTPGFVSNLSNLLDSNYFAGKITMTGIDSASYDYQLYYDKTTGNITYDSVVSGTGADLWTQSDGDIYPTTLTDSVGIGTSTPDEMLDVNGNIQIPATTATVGQIKQAGTVLMHTYHEKGDNNLYIGQGAGNFTADSSGNVGIGKGALSSITTGYSNVAIGMGAMLNKTTTNRSIAIGHNTFASSVGDNGSVGIGYQAGQASQAGAGGSVYIGTSAGYNLTNVYNIAIGSGALTGISTSNDVEHSIGIGWEAGYNSTNADYNILLGNKSGYSIKNGSYNVGIGSYSLYSNVGNTQSVAIGHQAMYYADSRASGRTTYNTAIGYETMKGSSTAANNTGQYNTAVGYQALYAMTSADSNAVIGVNALGLGTTASRNVIIGVNTADSITTGSGNIIIGNEAGGKLITQSNKLYIENSNSATPLIYGDFAADSVVINGDLTLTGDLLYIDTYWDDLTTSATASKKGINNKPTFSYDSLMTYWDAREDTTTGYEIYKYQLPHRWKAGTNIYAHVHYNQASAADTCTYFVIDYKWTDMGETTPAAFTHIQSTNQTVYPYTSGALHQLATFPAISGSGHTESSELTIILYLWSTSEMYTKFFDIHFEIDKPGSDGQFP